MGKINKKKFTKEIEHSESEDDYKSASENDDEKEKEDETHSEKKRKSNDSSEDEPLNENKKAKKTAKNAPAKSNGKKAKSKKDVSEVDDEENAEENGEEEVEEEYETTKKGVKNTPAKSNGRKAKSKKEKPENVDDNAVDSGDEEEEYEVKEIVDHKLEGGKHFFLVRWKGYTKDDDTWEPKDSLSCKELIEKFEKKKAEVSNGKSKKKADKKSPKAKGKKSLPSDPSKEWEVDKIIDYAVEKGVTLYRIRWKGFSAQNDTWEPRDNLFCDDLIDRFEKRMKTLENVSFKELREEPKKVKRLVNETAPRTNIRSKIERSSKRGASKKRVYYGDSDD